MQKLSINNRKKGEKAITLIALVITVIILLILAGTAISIGLNEGELFDITDTATKKTNMEALKESTSIAYVTAKAYGEGETFKEKLEGQMIGTTITEADGRQDILYVDKDRSKSNNI